MILYLDSSAAVKTYANEEHSQWTRVVLSKTLSRKDEEGRTGAVALASITYAEIRAALAAKLRAGEMPLERHDRAVWRLRSAFESAYAVRTVYNALMERAGDLALQHSLRGYDAVQLSVALAFQDDLKEEARRKAAVERSRWEQAREELPEELFQRYIAAREREEPPAPERLLLLSFDNALHDAAVAEGIAHHRPDRGGGMNPRST